MTFDTLHGEGHTTHLQFILIEILDGQFAIDCFMYFLTSVLEAELIITSFSQFFVRINVMLLSLLSAKSNSVYI